MTVISEDPRTVLIERIRTDLQRVEGRAERLHRTNVRLIVASLIASGLATLLAGLTAATGPVLGGAGVSGWRWTCGIVAVVSGLAGLLTLVHQRLQVAENLAQSRACEGRLKALELALTVKGRDALDVARDYEEVLAAHAAVLA